jgi:hypothetical protein
MRAIGVVLGRKALLVDRETGNARSIRWTGHKELRGENFSSGSRF